MGILYFTTTNEKMFNISGEKMINSFIKYANEDDRLYIFHETSIKWIKDTRIIYVNTKGDKIYDTWWRNNIDVIPEKYGGKCKEGDKRMNIGQMIKWNQKACFWFWKIVALFYAINYVSIEENKFENFVMLDIDTEFKTSIKKEFWESLMHEDKCCGYHLGKHRKNVNINLCAGVESGIVVFRNTYNGKKLANDIVNTFLTGKFKEYPRWDDGYVIRECVINNELCEDLTEESNVANVIGEGPFKGKIAHYKGTHWKRIK